MNAKHLLALLLAVTLLGALSGTPVAPVEAAPLSEGLAISLEVSGTLTHTYLWSLSGFTNQPTGRTIYLGDQAAVNYTVAVGRTVQPSDWRIAGTATLTNPTASNIKVRKVTIEYNGLSVAGTCAQALPYRLRPGKQMQCTFAPAPMPDGADVNAVLHVAADVDYRLTETFSFARDGQVTQVVNPQVTLRDDQGRQRVIGEPGAYTYTLIHDCSGVNPAEDPIAYFTQRVTLVETGATASAATWLECLLAGRDVYVNAGYTAVFDWGFDKQAPDEITLPLGQTTRVFYEIVTTPKPAFSEFHVRGSFVLYPPPSGPLEITALSATLTGGYTGPVTCDQPVPGRLNEPTACSFDIPLPDEPAPDTGLASIALTRTTYRYRPDGTRVPIGSYSETNQEGYYFDFSPSAQWEDDVILHGSVIEVHDTLMPEWSWTSSWSRSGDVNYYLPIGPYDTCGDYTIENTAWYEDVQWPRPVAADPPACCSDTHVLTVHVPCSP